MSVCVLPPLGLLRRKPVAALAGLALLGAAGTAQASAPPDYRSYRQGTFLRFLDAPAPGTAAVRSPHLGISFGGPVRPILVDTGSTGIVVSASRIPNVEALPGEPGTLTYSSSGRIMRGRWVSLPVGLWGADGASVTTKPVPVLAVERIDCTPRARDCTPEEAPGHVAMMGIGFGREGDSQAQSTPDTNPLLNRAGDRPEALRRGYVLSREGVHVGLTEANTRGDWRFVSLAPHPTIPGEWQGVPACIALDGQTPACGRALIDTGVTGMFLTLPPDRVADAGGDGLAPGLPPGTRVAVTFPAGNGAPAAGYAFDVGGDAPLAPSRIVLNTTRPKTFVNTGLHALNGFDVLYDADGGLFGFRPHPLRLDADR